MINNDNIKDMTKEGKCSRCGECCGLFIPFTKKVDTFLILF